MAETDGALATLIQRAERAKIVADEITRLTDFLSPVQRRAIDVRFIELTSAQRETCPNEQTIFACVEIGRQALLEQLTAELKTLVEPFSGPSCECQRMPAGVLCPVCLPD